MNQRVAYRTLPSKLWKLYRDYFLSHIPAHFIGFVTGVFFTAFWAGLF